MHFLCDCDDHACRAERLIFSHYSAFKAMNNKLSSTQNRKCICCTRTRPASFFLRLDYSSLRNGDLEDNLLLDVFSTRKECLELWFICEECRNKKRRKCNECDNRNKIEYANKVVNKCMKVEIKRNEKHALESTQKLKQLT